MSDGAIHIAKCWRCGWSSPPTETTSNAELFAGWHAIEFGCPVGMVRTIRTSETDTDGERTSA
jgi:hypothetical protein